MKDVKLSIDTGTFVRFWLVILGFAAVIVALWLVRSALVIIAISFFLALVLNRPVSWLARRLPGKSRAFATLIAYLFLMAIVVIVFFNVAPIFAKQISGFLSTLPETLHNLQINSSWLHDFLNQYNLTGQYNDWLSNIQGEIGKVASVIGSSFVDILSSLINVVVNVIFVAVLTFLMLVEAPKWEERFWRLVYRDDKKRKHHQQVVRKMYDVVGGYISGQIIVAAISASLTALAVMILSVIFDFEISIAWSAFSAIFVMTFVPMFGAMIGGTVVSLVLLLYSWPAAIIYAVYFIIEQQVENNLVQPHVQSNKLNMSALLVLMAVIVGLQAGGLLGALVAIPAAGCIVVLLHDFLKTRREKYLVGDDSVVDKEEAPQQLFAEKREFVKPKLLSSSAKKKH